MNKIISNIYNHAQKEIRLPIGFFGPTVVRLGDCLSKVQDFLCGYRSLSRLYDVPIRFFSKAVRYAKTLREHAPKYAYFRCTKFDTHLSVGNQILKSAEQFYKHHFSSRFFCAKPLRNSYCKYFYNGLDVCHNLYINFSFCHLKRVKMITQQEYIVNGV